MPHQPCVQARIGRRRNIKIPEDRAVRIARRGGAGLPGDGGIAQRGPVQRHVRSDVAEGFRAGGCGNRSRRRKFPRNSIPAPSESVPPDPRITLLAPVVRFPAEIVRVPFTVSSVSIVTPDASLTVRLLNVDPLIVWPPDPFKLNVPAPAVSVPEFDQLPPRLIVALAGENVPAVIVRFPATFSVAPLPPIVSVWR